MKPSKSAPRTGNIVPGDSKRGPTHTARIPSPGGANPPTTDPKTAKTDEPTSHDHRRADQTRGPGQAPPGPKGGGP